LTLWRIKMVTARKFELGFLYFNINLTYLKLFVFKLNCLSWAVYWCINKCAKPMDFDNFFISSGCVFVISYTWFGPLSLACKVCSVHKSTQPTTYSTTSRSFTFAFSENDQTEWMKWRNVRYMMFLGFVSARAHMCVRACACASSFDDWPNWFESYLLTSQGFMCYYIYIRKHAGLQVIESLRHKPEGRGFDSRWSHWNLWLTYSFLPHYGTDVDSVSNRNEY